MVQTSATGQRSFELTMHVLLYMLQFGLKMVQLLMDALLYSLETHQFFIHISLICFHMTREFYDVVVVILMSSIFLVQGNIYMVHDTNIVLFRMGTLSWVWILRKLGIPIPLGPIHSQDSLPVAPLQAFLVAPNLFFKARW